MRTLLFLSLFTFYENTLRVDLVKEKHRWLEYEISDSNRISDRCARAMLNESVKHTTFNFNWAWKQCPSLRHEENAN